MTAGPPSTPFHSPVKKSKARSSGVVHQVSAMAGPLTVTAIPSLATLWLLPKLNGFTRAYPEIELRVIATDSTPDLDAGEADLHIAFGIRTDPAHTARLLMSEEVFPVCSPDLLERGPPLGKPTDLAGHSLLHVEWTLGLPKGDPLDWQMWLRAAGAEQVDAERGARFTHSSLALQAAVDGQGVALGSESLAGDDLAAGRLVRPFDVTLPMNFAYYLVYPEDTAERPKIANFRNWILAEIAAGPSA